MPILRPLPVLALTALLTGCLASDGDDSSGGGGGGDGPLPAFSVRDADGVPRLAVPFGLGELINSVPAAAYPQWGGAVLFSSNDPDWVSNDTNSASDLFLYTPTSDTAGTVERVSNTLGANVAGNGASGLLPAYTSDDSAARSAWAMAGDGACIAFESEATNLVAGDDNGLADVFLRRKSGSTTTMYRASQDPVIGADLDAASRSPAVNDGCDVAFVTTAAALVSDNNGVADVYLAEFGGGLKLVSKSSSGTLGNGPSFGPLMARGTDLVFFLSWASNLVPDDTNNALDLFVHNPTTGITERVSVGTGGTQADLGLAGPGDAYDEIFASRLFAVSSYGRYVAFLSPATNLVTGDTNARIDAFLHDRTEDTTRRVSWNETSNASGATLDGIAVGASVVLEDTVAEKYPRVAFVSDQVLTGSQSTGRVPARDVYVREFKTNTLRRLTHDQAGTPILYGTHPQIAGDGTTVYFSGRVETETAGVFLDTLFKSLLTP